MKKSLSSRLLVIHADDLGLCDSVNAASLNALEQGIITSASIMVPCASFAQASRFGLGHPELDLGIHVTLTSEWQNYRWGPVADRREVSSLIDSGGHFYPDVRSFAAIAEPNEVKIEMRAQIEVALASGLHPTHVDCHMYAVAATPELYRAFVEVASEYHLPHIILSPVPASSEKNMADRWWFNTTPAIFDINSSILPEEWNWFYRDALTSISNGIYQLTVHLGFDEPQLRAITAGSSAWNAAWRQRDLDAISSGEFRDLLIQKEISLIEWRDLACLLKRHGTSSTDPAAVTTPEE